MFRMIEIENGIEAWRALLKKKILIREVLNDP